MAPNSRFELESPFVILLELVWPACCITILRTTHLNFKSNQDSFGNSSFMSWTSKKTVPISYCLQLRVFEKMVAQAGSAPAISWLWAKWVKLTSLPRNREIENHSLEKQSSKGETKAWLITSGQSCMQTTISSRLVINPPCTSLSLHFLSLIAYRLSVFCI